MGVYTMDPLVVALVVAVLVSFAITYFEQFLRRDAGGSTAQRTWRKIADLVREMASDKQEADAAVEALRSSLPERLPEPEPEPESQPELRTKQFHCVACGAPTANAEYDRVRNVYRCAHCGVLIDAEMRRRRTPLEREPFDYGEYFVNCERQPYTPYHGYGPSFYGSWGPVRPDPYYVRRVTESGDLEELRID